jgi:RES domain-containing protein
MPEAWRIVKAKHAATAFSGEGAARTGGRWNSRGVRVVYTSSTKSLAALESLVHLNPPAPFKYVAIRITFDDALVKIVTPKALPPNWRVEPPPPSTKALGDMWVREAGSAVLALPSVIIPGETNYLLNPAHPGFKKISIGKPERFAFDPRLLRTNIF